MNSLNILVVRADRIGDVILSTPVIEALRKHYPNARITVLVRSLVAPLLRGLSSVDEVLEYDPDGRHAGFNGLFNLIRDLRERKFRIAVVLHSQAKIAAAIFGSGIPNRVGPISRPHSFLFYNRGIRQRRSHVEMHEADYNLQLLRRLGIRSFSREIPPKVSIRVEIAAEARTWLTGRGLEPKKFIVVHPGMGGSALNWPEAYYAELIRLLARDGRQVLVTSGPREDAILALIERTLDGWPKGVHVFRGDHSAGIEFLGGLFYHASVVVAPSTGPLHLASALGRPTVSFYPPIRVQSAIRWGPYVQDESQCAILVPEAYCGQDFRCKGPQCTYYPCMRTITVGQAFDEVKRLSKEGSESQA